MASRTVDLIQDQNLNVHFNGKANISKAPRKAGIGGRKPLGDLSNSVKPTANQTSKKENSKIISSNKKGVSKASEKVQASGRKPLSDISNSGKPQLKGTLKKNQSPKLSIPVEDRCQLIDIAEEGFLHNHEECIKQQNRATNNFLPILGLDDFCKHSASAKECSLSNRMEPVSPSWYTDLDDMNYMIVMLIEELSPPKHKLSRNLESWPASPEREDDYKYMQWDDINYKLIESP